MKEFDPNGLDPHAGGAKLDAGKLLAAQVLGAFAPALAAVAEVGTIGAKKYCIGGWLLVDNGEARYADAGFRHWLKRMVGERKDPDTKCLHLAHEAWNKLAELTLHLKAQNDISPTIDAPGPVDSRCKE